MMDLYTEKTEQNWWKITRSNKKYMELKKSITKSENMMDKKTHFYNSKIMKQLVINIIRDVQGLFFCEM